MKFSAKLTVITSFSIVLGFTILLFFSRYADSYASKVLFGAASFSQMSIKPSYNDFSFIRRGSIIAEIVSEDSHSVYSCFKLHGATAWYLVRYSDLGILQQASIIQISNNSPVSTLLHVQIERSTRSEHGEAETPLFSTIWMTKQAQLQNYTKNSRNPNNE